jgi:L-lactate dehydrogenase complex protein LldG
MSSGREQILGGIRKALKRGPVDAAKAAELRTRLANPVRNLIPKRAESLDPPAQIDLFVAMAEEVQTTVVRVASLADVPDAVASYLAAENLPAELAMSPDPALDTIPWSERPLLRLRRGKAEPGDQVSLTPCFAGIAETGTLMLTSGAATPSTLNFLPDTHIVVVRADQVVPTYEEGWTRLRARQRSETGDGAMPRTVNFVTGPSRTGDIEQRIQLGAHGPRRLHIVLVDGSAKPAEAEPVLAEGLAAPRRPARRAAAKPAAKKTAAPAEN